MASPTNAAVAAAMGGGAAAGYPRLFTEAMPMAVGVGWRGRPLGPQTVGCRR